MMIRKAATSIASFAFGVLITLALQDTVTPNAVAQTMPLKEKPPSTPPLGKPTPPPLPPNIHFKFEPWQQYVNDWLAQFRREDQKQDAQLSQLSSQVSSLNSQVSNLTSALNKLQTRFENHYHKYYAEGSTGLSIQTLLVCHGYGSTCTEGTNLNGPISIPVQTSNPSGGGYVPTSVSIDGPPAAYIKRPPRSTH